jgi:tetratricopeptide (TPR) repeat protein
MLRRGLVDGYGDYVWRLAGVVEDYLDNTGAWPELLAAGTAALAGAEQAGEREKAAQIRRGLARVHAGLRDYVTAIDHMARATPVFVALDDRKSLAGIHLGSAWLRARAGRPAAGGLHADRMLSITREHAEPIDVASALNALAWYQAVQAKHDAAIGHCREALTILHGLGARRAQADTWDTLGYVNHRRGRHRESLLSYRRALVLHREFGARAAEAETLRRIAAVAIDDYDVATAKDALDRAVDIRRELGDPAAARMVPAADSHDR